MCLGVNFFSASEKDGLDNTVFESRWSCSEKLESSETTCYIIYEFEEDFVVDHLTMCECGTISPGEELYTHIFARLISCQTDHKGSTTIDDRREVGTPTRNKNPKRLGSLKVTVPSLWPRICDSSSVLEGSRQ